MSSEAEHAAQELGLDKPAIVAALKANRAFMDGTARGIADAKAGRYRPIGAAPTKDGE
jgi:hypothetical protein